jgi:ATP-dependent Lon protease
MAVAMISALSGRPVAADVAMTGELTLTGRVMAIGGVKEKVLGALRAGIKKIVLPKDNKGDVEELPESVREVFEFVYAETLDDVLAVALRPAAD